MGYKEEAVDEWKNPNEKSSRPKLKRAKQRKTTRETRNEAQNSSTKLMYGKDCESLVEDGSRELDDSLLQTSQREREKE